jgi:hypothetical protein
VLKKCQLIDRIVENELLSLAVLDAAAIARSHFPRNRLDESLLLFQLGEWVGVMAFFTAYTRCLTRPEVQTPARLPLAPP